jgi:hypothetical protein
MVNIFLKILGYVRCGRCKRVFLKNKSTTIGGGFKDGTLITQYYCNPCTNKVMTKVFEGKELTEGLW